MSGLRSMVLGACLWVGCASSVEDSAGPTAGTPADVTQTPAPGGETPAPQVPATDSRVPPPETSAACSGPDGTARLAWSHDAAWNRTVDFRGLMDADGNTYWTECESSYWVDKDPSLLACQLVSVTPEGTERYRRDLPPPGAWAAHTVEGDQLFVTGRLALLSARDVATGQERWSVSLGAVKDEDPAAHHALRIESLVRSPPYLVALVHDTFGDVGAEDLLVAVRADTGAVAWKVPVPPVHAPLVVDAEGNVYGGASDVLAQRTALFSYTVDGQLRWRTERTGVVEPTAVDGGTLLLGRAELVDAATGASLATLATASAESFYYSLGRSSSPFGRAALQAGELLVLPDMRCATDGCPTTAHPGGTFLYGLDPESGAVRWHRAVGTWPTAPLLTQRGALLLVDRPVNAPCGEYGCTGDDAAIGSFLRELGPDGRELSACALTGKAPYITPPALHRGRVVLGAWTNWDASNDWTQRMSIRAFDLTTPDEPASGGWVSAGGGNTRSGQTKPTGGAARAAGR
ncbi:PQQ-binding-like beta-propeller repeat protein [Corallococcus macrosporus]|uniref:outer membrane protein assembly factor BamB family protein n=1 Tax=Corallococcus macrosporus TaxID=35 RepID=UPI001EE6385C|nr:PQQ-binding-like beta-propeller repeat protein [Corallococcus macrosporus]